MGRAPLLRGASGDGLLTRHLPSPCTRYELTLSDSAIIGMRRAAQRMLGEGLKRLANLDAAAVTPELVESTLEAALAEMAK